MTKDIDGVISFALSHGRGSCRNPMTFRSEMIPFHEQMIKTSIAESHIPRILISVGKDDHCVGVTFTPLVAESLGKHEYSLSGRIVGIRNYLRRMRPRLFRPHRSPPTGPPCMRAW